MGERGRTGGEWKDMGGRGGRQEREKGGGEGKDRGRIGEG